MTIEPQERLEWNNARVLEIVSRAFHNCIANVRVPRLPSIQILQFPDWIRVSQLVCNNQPIKGYYCIVLTESRSKFTLQFVFFNLLEDALFYWVHRLFHQKTMFRKYHYIHHKYNAPYR